jgi:SPW repeat
MAILIIASPWIFGFSDISDAKTVAIVVGVGMLLSGLMTQWRYSLAKLIPLSMHFATDLLLGAVLVLSPFVLGFDDNGGATRWAIIVGAIELITALGTRWEHEDTDARVGRTHPAA